MSTHAELLREHATLPPFTPFLPPSSLPKLALGLLTAAFVLSFYFSTIRFKGLPTQEVAVGSLASLVGGFGLVFAFCAVGVNV